MGNDAAVILNDETSNPPGKVDGNKISFTVTFSDATTLSAARLKEAR